MMLRRKSSTDDMSVEMLARIARWLREDLARLQAPREPQRVVGKPPNAVAKWLQRKGNEEGGAVGVIICILLPLALIPLLALTIDSGLRALTEAKVQEAVDAGALAGGYSCLHGLGRDDAIANAETLVELNEAQLVSVSVEACNAEGDESVDVVKVTASASWPRWLGGDATVQRSATASWSSGYLELVR